MTVINGQQSVIRNKVLDFGFQLWARDFDCAYLAN